MGFQYLFFYINQSYQSDMKVYQFNMKPYQFAMKAYQLGVKQERKLTSASRSLYTLLS